MSPIVSECSGLRIFSEHKILIRFFYVMYMIYLSLYYIIIAAVWVDHTITPCLFQPPTIKHKSLKAHKMLFFCYRQVKTI